MEAIFVAEGKVMQQIADGDDAGFGEGGAAFGADAFDVFYRVGEGNGH